MYCNFCGKKLEDGATFCSYCGTRLKDNEFNVNLEKAELEIEELVLKEFEKI